MSPAESVLVISGAQQGLDLLARCLIDPGDSVIVDRPGYLGAIQSFHAAGAKLIGWDIAKADVDELEDLLVRYRPKLIYTNPTFENPTGITMPIRTRRELLRLAERYRVPIVEDATYRELYFRDPPPPSLRDLDAPDIVIYLNSFSKVLAPGLRLGWLSAAPSIVDQMAIIKQRLDPHTQNLVQFAMATLIRDGSFDAHLGTLRTEHARRCTAMLASIQRHFPPGALQFARPQGGLYLWCRVAPHISTRSLLDRALAAGVAFVPGHAFYPDPAGDSELRICSRACCRQRWTMRSGGWRRRWPKPRGAARAIAELAGTAACRSGARSCRRLEAASYFVTITATRPVRSRTVTPTSCAWRSKSRSSGRSGADSQAVNRHAVEELGKAGVGHVHLTFDGVDREAQARLQDQENSAGGPGLRRAGHRIQRGPFTWSAAEAAEELRHTLHVDVQARVEEAFRDSGDSVGQAVPPEAGRCERVVVRPDRPVVVRHRVVARLARPDGPDSPPGKEVGPHRASRPRAAPGPHP